MPAALILFAVALVAYAFTLYRTVPGGDSGELILAAETLGVAHPPGYPLFTMLGKLFSLLPVSTIAWRINLLSAVCDAGAAALLLLATARWTGSVWAGVLAGGLFAFSPLVWSNAVGAEVFALNNLFCAGLIWLLIRFFQRPDEPAARATALCCGLGLSNHHLFALFAIPAAIAVLWSGRRFLFRGRSFAMLVGCFCVGLIPYVYLPLASARHPLFGWGDVTTLDGFLAHFLRRGYGTFDLALPGQSGTSTLEQRALLFLGQLPRELGYWGLPLSIFGAWAALRAKPGRAVQLLLLAMLAIYLGIFIVRANLPLTYSLQRGIVSRFWQQANLIVFFWAGVGLWALAQSLGVRFDRAARNALPVIAIVGAVVPLALHFRAQDQSRTTAVRDFARGVLEALPPNALLISSGDYLTHSVLYLQTNDRLREDVRVVDHVLLQQPWEVQRLARHVPGITLPGTRLSPQAVPESFNLAQFMESNSERFPIFVANGIRIPDASYQAGYDSWPIGLVQWMRPKAQELSFEEWMRLDAEALAHFTPPAPGRYPEESWEYETLRQYWFARYTHGVELINYAARHNNDDRASARAVSTLESVVAAGVFRQPEVFKNLGGAYFVRGARDSLARMAMNRNFARYLELDPQAPDRDEIRSLMTP